MAEKAPPRQFGTAKEISALCGVALRTVYRLARCGRIAAEKAPGAGWTVGARRSRLTGRWCLIAVRR